MLYRPKLKNGKFVQLSWPISLFRLFNFICWPLEDNAANWSKILDRSYFILFLIIYVQHNDAHTRFFITKRHDLDLMLGILPVYLVQVEMTLRGIHISLHQEEFKQLLKKFYADIYIERSTNPKLFQSIQRKLLPTFTYSSTYILTLALYVATPSMSLYNQRRDLLYDMIYPFDITPLYVYLPVVMLSVWFSSLAVTMLFGEANVMSEIILHLHGQYLMLGEDLRRSSKELLQEADKKTISRKFSQKLKKIIQRNVELNEFAAEFQKCFSFRIFIIFSFAAMVLCILGFKVYTNVSEGISFVIWMISKTVELLAFGDVGSTLEATSNEVSSMYYNSNWEVIISTSSNTQENIYLMKLLVIAIETNGKPFALTGLHFFSVSQTSVLKILKASASYFTCLISFRTNL